MVYRGRPSKGCAECRAKKTRVDIAATKGAQHANHLQCDAVRPACGQCRRSGRICTGYRNLQELRLLDQSSEVVFKLSAPRESRTHSEALCEFSSSPSSHSTSSEEALELTAVRAFPEPSFWLEGNARQIFFDQFINVPGDHPKTDLGFVTPIYDNACTNTMLESIISALGMSVLLKRRQDTSLAILASQKYSHALQKTQSALQTPKLAKSDETIATVLLLGLHELVAVNEPATDVSRLAIHLHGALKLLRLRGSSQMRTNWGNRMFHRVSSQLLYSCLFTRRPIPTDLLKFQRSVIHTMHREEISGVELTEMAARLCDILSATNDIEQVDAPIASTHLQALLVIETELSKWETSLSPRLVVLKEPVHSPDKSFLAHKNIFQNHIAGTLLNKYYCVRLQTNEEILRLAALVPTHKEHIEAARSVVTEMSTEICRSVPFFLGDDACWGWQETSQIPAMHGGVAMLMPMTFAASPERISPAMYGWLLQQIGRLADDTGISQAKRVMDVLKTYGTMRKVEGATL